MCYDIIQVPPAHPTRVTVTPLTHKPNIDGSTENIFSYTINQTLKTLEIIITM